MRDRYPGEDAIQQVVLEHFPDVRFSEREAAIGEFFRTLLKAQDAEETLKRRHDMRLVSEEMR